jgi:uroporphyrinogen-III synthase
LRELGLGVDLPASAPTTEGVIATLSPLALAGRRIGVQLYPDHTHEELLDFLAGAGAIADPVTPYVYASASEDGRVVDLIESLAAGTVDIIAFTSAPQVRRSIAVAEASGLAAKLQQGLTLTRVAAVGPVVTDELTKFGISVEIAPKERFFMKPLMNAMIEAAGRCHATTRPEKGQAPKLPPSRARRTVGTNQPSSIERHRLLHAGREDAGDDNQNCIRGARGGVSHRR